MSVARFLIDVDTTGRGSVVVNDEDVSDQVAGFTLQAQLGQVPVLTLIQQGDGKIEGAGIVRVMPGGRTPGEEIAGFLDAIDSQELERAVLEQCGMGDSGMAVALEVLKGWALGSA